MYNGIINVYKERGFTSHDVVAKLRGILKQKKIGHTGTLDPDATGVLPVCLGTGTRLCDMLTDTDKTYRAELMLGRVTDTQDISGAVIGGGDVVCTAEELADAIMSFVGEYKQIPPMYSAIKQNGKKLYELARAGREVEREARAVVIYDIKIESIELPYAVITVKCSKGTYIRTLCHDIGQTLSCGACMTSLVRERAGGFVLAESLTLSQIEELCAAGSFADRVIAPDKLFEAYEKCHMTPEGDRAVHNGNPFKLKDTVEGMLLSGHEKLRVYDSSNEFIGVFGYRTQKGLYFPDKMFYVNSGGLEH